MIEPLIIAVLELLYVIILSCPDICYADIGLLISIARYR